MNIFRKHQIVINIIFDDNYGFKESDIKKIIRKTINLTFSELNDDYKKKYEVNILLAKNEQMKKINRKYRKINKVTNVLSFPQRLIISNLGKPKLLLGDIVLSLDKLRNEAGDQSKKFKNHLTHIIMHGFMHLLGFDHENEKEAKVMEEKEKDILLKLSIDDPYI